MREVVSVCVLALTNETFLYRRRLRALSLKTTSNTLTHNSVCDGFCVPKEF